MLYTSHIEKVILIQTIPSNLAFDSPVNEETKKFTSLNWTKIALWQWAIALESKKLKVTRHQMLYTRQVEKVILIQTIPSNLTLDIPVNEETK